MEPFNEQTVITGRGRRPADLPAGAPYVDADRREPWPTNPTAGQGDPEYDRLREEWCRARESTGPTVMVEPTGSLELVAGSRVYNVILVLLVAIFGMLTIVAIGEIVLLIKFSAFLTAITQG